MSNKKRKARKAAKKRAQALKSFTTAVGLATVAFSAGALQGRLKKRVIDLFQKALSRIEGLREACSGSLKGRAGGRKDSGPNGGVMVS